MSPRSPLRRFLAHGASLAGPVFSLALLLALLTGCSPIQLAPSQTIGGAPAPAAPNQPTFTVEVRPSGGEPMRKQLVMSEPITVQQLLEKTGALSQFGRMDITVVRPVPGRREPLRLDVEFRRGERAVAPQEDYALQPGDQVIIEQVRRTMIEDWLDQASEMLGPLATMR